MSNYVVSISREFGSGGRLIGKKLAASLGIPCYDRTLIQKTAEKSGLSPDFIARAEERARSRFHLNIAPIGIGVPTFTHQGIPVSHEAFFAQADVIRELAAEGPCLLDVAISRDQNVFPMVAPGKALDDVIGAIDVAVGAVRTDMPETEDEDGRKGGAL